MIFSPAAVPPGFQKFSGSPGALGGYLRGPVLAAPLERTDHSGAARVEHGLEFLRRSVAQNLAGFRVPEPTVTAFEAPALPTARETADNILGFIRSRLDREVAAGADAERYQGLLAAAREGFERGYQQALGDLEALGLLNEDLAAEIGQTHDFVTAGLDELAGQAPAAAQPAVPAPTQFESYRQRVSVVQNETLELEVRTRDGDRVRIQLESLDAFSSDQSVSSLSGASGTAVLGEFSATRITSDRFSVRVQGDLDEDERAALSDLLGRVDSLSDQFFSGDPQLALEQALNLGYDQDEIAGFSLRLTATDVRQVTETYQRVSQFGDTPADRGASDLAHSLQSLGQFLQAARAAVEDAQALSQPGRLLQQLLEGSLSFLQPGHQLDAIDSNLLNLLGLATEDAEEAEPTIAEAA